jgi:glycosyltransferase involved in cell wall biosynthesis
MPRNRQGRTDIHVAHCVGFYFPQTVGGTEVYVHDLTTELSRDSISSSIVAATSRDFERFDWEGIPVLRYPNNWADVHSSTSPAADLSKFQELIRELDPDIFHLHSWTTGAGLRHLAQVAELGIPCVVTMHVPSALCLRGTMLLKGENPCDGRIDEKRCGQCWAMSHGLPEPLAFCLAQLPRLAVSGSRFAKVSRRMAIVLSVRSLVKVQADDLQTMASLCERIVAPSQWVYSALAANAVPSRKLIVSRQAVAPSLVDQGSRKPQKTTGGEIRIGFVGRLEHYKGAHILLEAMARIPADIPVRLLVVGSGTDLAYLGELEALANGDKRIEFLGAMPHDRLSEFLEQIDVLAVPSNYMETGPLVVLEAFAFGVPVMGANIGGIAERIRDGIDGWLLQFDDSQAWGTAMQDAALNRDKVARFAGNILPSRTMANVASDMATVYREILEAKAGSAMNAASGGPSLESQGQV